MNMAGFYSLLVNWVSRTVMKLGSDTMLAFWSDSILKVTLRVI